MFGYDKNSLDLYIEANEMITIQELEDIEYRVVLHSKKVNNYTHVELSMLYRINQDAEYAVNKKQKRVYTSDSLDGALDQYNKIQDFKHDIKEI